MTTAALTGPAEFLYVANQVAAITSQGPAWGKLQIGEEAPFTAWTYYCGDTAQLTTLQIATWGGDHVGMQLSEARYGEQGELEVGIGGWSGPAPLERFNPTAAEAYNWAAIHLRPREMLRGMHAAKSFAHMRRLALGVTCWHATDWEGSMPPAERLY